MSPRDRRALMFGAGVIGVAVLYRLALAPAVAQWSQARADTVSQTQRVLQFEERLEKRNDIRLRLMDRFGPGVQAPLLSVDQARVAFPRSVQEAFGRAGASARQVEVQSVRRIRDLSGVELLSIRVQGGCEADQIPALLRELSQSEVPVIIESLQLTMAGRNDRENWQATLVLSTPARTQGVANRGGPAT